MKKTFRTILTILSIIFSLQAVHAKSSLEISGAAGFLDPAQYIDSFSGDFMSSLPADRSFVWDTWRDAMLVDASLAYYFHMGKHFGLGLTAAYMYSNLTLHYKLDDQYAMRAEMGWPAAYVGLATQYRMPLSSRLSLIAGLDAGLLAPLGMKYDIYPPDEPGAEDKLDDLGIGAYRQSGRTSETLDPVLAANLKIGIQYLFSPVSGLSLYGGYKAAKFVVKYPDQLPFNATDADGQGYFGEHKLDLSGPFLQAGLVFLFGAGNSQTSSDVPPQGKEGTVRLQEYNAPKKTELEKFFDLEKFANRFRRRPDSKVALYMSSLPGKPDKIPVYKPLTFHAAQPAAVTQKPSMPKIQAPLQKPNVPVYSNATFAFVDSDAETKRWFAPVVKNAPNVKKILWQVARAPFSGSINDWKTPNAMVASGTLPASQKEFSLDFKNLNKGKLQRVNLIKRLFISADTYYVRALPLDGSGNLIGEPDLGMAVRVGKPQMLSVTPKPAYELWTPSRGGYGKYSGENQDLPVHLTQIRIAPAGETVYRLFDFHDLKDLECKIIIQVSDQPFSPSDAMIASKALQYSKLYSLPARRDSGPSEQNYPAAVIIPFHEFAKNYSQLKQGEFYKYYVRGVVLKPGAMLGTVEPQLTDVITVDYGLAEPITWYEPPKPKEIEIPYALPSINIKSYTPMQEQAHDYLQHYYVHRAPTADEVLCRWRRDSDGYVLIPYLFHEAYFAGRGIQSKAAYEQIEIPKVLSVGTRIYFPPPEPDDKTWYQQLYDGVVGFFEDLIGIVGQLINQVANSYNQLKADLINVVAELCPAQYRDTFRAVVEGFVNYGLVVVGLPPTLPNFDQLSQMSVDYMTQVALTEAGLPANEITEELTQQVASEMVKQIEEAANRPAPNPINAPFLKLDPAYLYRPAYVDVEIKNESEVETIPGRFNLSTTFEFDYYNQYSSNNNLGGGISFNVPTNYSYASSAGIIKSLEYQEHFRYGLNAYSVAFSQGEKAIYDVFLPVVDQEVPLLKSGESTSVRIYLTPYSGGPYARYPGAHNVQDNDFLVMYYLNGNKDFTYFRLFSSFPSAQEYASKIGFLNTEENSILVYKGCKTSSVGVGSVFEPQKPVNQAW